MSINDEWVRYLRAEGYLGNINDMLRTALQAEAVSSYKNLNDLWVAYLTSEGYTGHINDMMYNWLGAKGYTGNLNDRLLAALKADDIFAAAAVACIFTLQGDLGAFGLTTFPTISDKTVSVTADGTSNYGVSSGIAGIPVDWADKRIAEFEILTFTAADTVQEPIFQMLRPSDNDLVQALWSQSLGQWIFTIVDNGSVTLGQINITGAVTDIIAIGIDGSNGDAFITRNGATVVTKSTTADSGTFAGLGALFASQNAVIITQLRNAAASTAYSAKVITEGVEMQAVYADTTLRDWCGQDTVPKFDPSSLFGVGDEGDYWDFTDISTLYQDTSKTTPVTISGDVIGAVSGKRSSIDLLQATTASKPILATALGRQGADMTVSSVGKFLTGTSPSMGGDVTFVSSFDLQTVITVGPILDLRQDTSNFFQVYANSGSAQVTSFAKIAGANYSPALISVGTGQADILAENDTSVPDVSISSPSDGLTNTVASNASASFGTSINLGRNPSSTSQRFDGVIFRAFIINRVLTDIEKALVVEWSRGAA